MAFTGAAIWGAVTTVGTAAAGAATALAPIISAGSGIAGIAQTMRGSSQQVASPLQLQQAPRVPEYLAIETAEKQKILRTAQNRTKTILTNPLGEVDGGVIKAKQLVGKLGQ